MELYVSSTRSTFLNLHPGGAIRDFGLDYCCIIVFWHQADFLALWLGCQIVNIPRYRICADDKVQIAGLMQSLAGGLYYNETIIWPPSNRPMSPEIIDDLLDNVPVDVVLLAPSLLEDISQSKSSLEKFRKLKAAATGGG